MKVTLLSMPDVLLIEPRVFGDERGFFFESYNQDVFRNATGQRIEFVQDNHSRSQKNTLRGLHYQLPPYAQAKLVRVTRGKVFDVVVDIRKRSPTFGKWVGEILSEENQHQLFIPEGFAHGFIVLSETADFLYKTSSYYHKESDRAIKWDDPDIGIDWPLEGLPLVSDKDKNANFLRESDVFV